MCSVSFSEIGTTLAWLADSGEAVIGADMTLQALSAELAKQKPTPGSQLALFDDDGKAIAYTDFGRLLQPDTNGKLTQAGLDGLGVPVLNVLAQKWTRSEERTALLNSGPFDVEADGQAWRTIVTDLPVRGGPSFHLAMAVPQDDILAGARHIRQQFILVILAVIALMVPVTLWIAASISRPIKALWQEAELIRHFNFKDPVKTNSMIAELVDLADAMGSMKSSIRRFVDISQSVASEPNFEKLLPELLNETISAAGAAAGVLYLPGDDPLVLDAAACRLSGQREGPDGLPALSLSEPFIAAAIAARLSSGSAIPDAMRRPNWLGGLLDDQPATAQITVPLLVRERGLVGVMVLLCDRLPDQALVAFIQALSGSMAVTLEARELIQAQKRLEAAVSLIREAAGRHHRRQKRLYRRPLRPRARTDTHAGRSRRAVASPAIPRFHHVRGRLGVFACRRLAA
jgi:hypothetical protein